MTTAVVEKTRPVVLATEEVSDAIIKQIEGEKNLGTVKVDRTKLVEIEEIPVLPGSPMMKMRC